MIIQFKPEGARILYPDNRVEYAHACEPIATAIPKGTATGRGTLTRDAVAGGNVVFTDGEPPVLAEIAIEDVFRNMIAPVFSRPLS